jgi:hypothetical protein
MKLIERMFRWWYGIGPESPFPQCGQGKSISIEGAAINISASDGRMIRLIPHSPSNGVIVEVVVDGMVTVRKIATVERLAAICDVDWYPVKKTLSPIDQGIILPLSTRRRI